MSILWVGALVLNDPVLKAFESQLTKDLGEGRNRPLADYLQEVSPDLEEGLVRRWLAMKTERRVREELSKDGDFGSGAFFPEDLSERYRILERIGSGGQGTVFLAEETSALRRKVALKCLHGLDRPGAEPLRQRLKQGARVLGRLSHPFICTIIEANLDARVPYVVMRYVQGESLAAKIDTALRAGQTDSWLHLDFQNSTLQVSSEHASVAPLSESLPMPMEVAPAARGDVPEPLRVVALIEQIARTLHWAHEEGVVHRDVKPGNIMVTPEGYGILMDFDLARDSSSHHITLTRSGEAFGTPAYMAPELLRDTAQAGDRRVDIWALGVTLYQCLTLRRPFHGSSRQGLFQAILTRDPPPLHRSTPSVPRDLEIVMQRVLEKDQDRRYQTALEFAEDLNAVLRGDHPKARPPSLLRRTLRTLQRRPSIGLAILFALAFGATLCAFLGARAAEERNLQLAQQKDEELLALRRLGEVASPELRWMRALEDRLLQEDGLTEEERGQFAADLERLEAFASDQGQLGFFGTVGREHARLLASRIRELLGR